MYTDARDFIFQLGGYRSVATRLKKRPTTVHSHMQAGVLPAAWYPALCSVASEFKVAEPQRELFSFIELPERDDAGTSNSEEERAA